MKEDEELEVVENWKDMNSDKVRLESSLQVATTQNYARDVCCQQQAMQ